MKEVRHKRIHIILFYFHELLEKAKHRDRKQISGCQRLSWGRGPTARGYTWELYEWGNTENQGMKKKFYRAGKSPFFKAISLLRWWLLKVMQLSTLCEWLLLHVNTSVKVLLKHCPSGHQVKLAIGRDLECTIWIWNQGVKRLCRIKEQRPRMMPQETPGERP